MLYAGFCTFPHPTLYLTVSFVICYLLYLSQYLEKSPPHNMDYPGIHHINGEHLSNHPAWYSISLLQSEKIQLGLNHSQGKYFSLFSSTFSLFPFLFPVSQPVLATAVSKEINSTQDDSSRGQQLPERKDSVKGGGVASGEYVTTSQRI